MNVGIAGTPGTIGGASTKIIDLIRLLEKHVNLSVITANRKVHLEEAALSVLRECRCEVITRFDAERRAFDAVIGVCELDIFSSGFADKIKECGARFLWSNDMMWAFHGEREAAARGVIDRVIYVSEGQAQAFSSIYAETDAVLIPNYINPDDFPEIERANRTFTIGRLSRPDPVKYPVDFPLFYEGLALDEVIYRVQAWSPVIGNMYKWHTFGREWELLPAGKMASCKFLQSLDLFVYPLGHRVVESWGRSTVESMLTGCVAVVPAGHQFHKILVDRQCGYIFNDFEECREIVQELFADGALRRRIGREAALFARSVLCNTEQHRELWLKALCFN